MNQAMIAGHLGADPEVRFTSSGQKVTVLRLAARARKDETIWWRVTIWGEAFDKMMPYLKKGGSLIVFGEVDKPEIFTDREGKSQVSMHITAHSIKFSPFGKPEGSKTANEPAFATATATATTPANEPASPFGSSMGQGTGFSTNFSDDEVPF